MKALTELFTKKAVAEQQTTAGQEVPPMEERRLGGSEPVSHSSAPNITAKEEARARDLILLETAEKRLNQAMADGLDQANYENCLLMRDAIAACRSIVNGAPLSTDSIGKKKEI